jgi:predicted nuclease of predicted toxin-antitoxin system
MKFLADMGISQTVVRLLQELNYDAIHLRDQSLQRLPDTLIMAKAKSENRIILTFDLDFGDLLAFSGDSLPSVIIFRLEQAKPNYVMSKLNPVLTQCQNDLAEGSIIIIKDNGYRVRKLPISLSN